MEDAQYVAHIAQRAAQLDACASKIKRAQGENARQRTIERSAFLEEIHSLLLAVQQTEQELRILAKVTKQLITILQYSGMQSQLTTLQERADMLGVENLITKKELKRILLKNA